MIRLLTFLVFMIGTFYLYQVEETPVVRSYPTINIADAMEIYCISHAVYHEARGEPKVGQLAVAFVINTRMGSKDFPNNACDVVYAPDQFENIKKTVPNKVSIAWKLAVFRAYDAFYKKVKDPTNGAKHFVNPKKMKTIPDWMEGRTILANIGEHEFFNTRKR